MNAPRRLLATSLILAAMTAAPAIAGDDSPVAEEMERAEMAANVLHEMMASPDSAIPASLLDQAQAVAVIPHVVKGAVGVGARHGKGLVTQRNEKGEWTSPVYVSLTGLSYGVQIGVNATDVVLVFTEKGGLKALLEDKVKLGGDVAIAAGPLGRSAEVGTNATLDAGIYAYSRSKGIFAGAALDGAVLDIDDDANRAVYGQTFDPAQAMANAKQVPAGLNAFLNALAAAPREQS